MFFLFNIIIFLLFSVSIFKNRDVTLEPNCIIINILISLLPPLQSWNNKKSFSFDIFALFDANYVWYSHSHWILFIFAVFLVRKSRTMLTYLYSISLTKIVSFSFGSNMPKKRFQRFFCKRTILVKSEKKNYSMLLVRSFAGFSHVVSVINIYSQPFNLQVV